MEEKSNLVAHLHTAANVDVIDDSHALFGELYTAQQVWSALWDDSVAPSNDNVGSPTTGNNHNNNLSLCSQDLPLAAFMNSKHETVTPHEIAVEIHNTTANWTVRVRWIDSMGNNNASTHLWNVLPSSTLEQYTTPGHLFVLSLVPMPDSDEELILGAYRPKRALPSLTPHCILAHGGAGNDDLENDGYDNGLPFLLETLFLDETKFDALVVAASDLDHGRDRTSAGRQSAHRTVHMLQTILKNSLQHPQDEKFQKLRLSNPKIRQFIGSSWAAQEMLKIVGFVQRQLPATTTTTPVNVNPNDNNVPQEEPYLVLSNPASETTRRVGEQALDLLRLLDMRLAPDFIPDLAPPTPWQVTGAFAGSSNNSRWNNHRGFITDEERWARAERAAGLRRSGAARRPAPGEAPSSRGKWGR